MGLSASGSPLRLAAVVAAVLPAACALMPGPRYEIPAGPRRLDQAAPRERFEYVRRAEVWRPVAHATLDLLAGPPGADAFTFDQVVGCDYDLTKPLSGNTPKFNCRLPDGDVVKVKYGARNGEVYAEVAATRLAWALGFGADRQYPVRVVCAGCPPDPWEDRRAVPGAEHTFDPAIIERKVEGEEIRVRGVEPGWAWWELRAVEERAGGAPRAHVDALRLLAAFIQHSDNKDEQQRLVCLPEGIVEHPDGSVTCTKPFLFLTDLGATFARADLANRNKMQFDNWSAVPVWKSRPQCVAQLKRSWTGTLGHPRISEAGRSFLGGLLMQLSDGQIRDIFRAARVERRGEQILEGERRRPVTVDDWAEAFKRKRDEIVRHRCAI